MSESAATPSPEQILAFTIEYLRLYMADLGHPVDHLSDAEIQQATVRVRERVAAYLVEELRRG